VSKWLFESDSGNDCTLNEILLARRNSPPKDPAVATFYFIDLLARALLRRETRATHRVQVMRDFEEASLDLAIAAGNGATAEEQAEILHTYWKHFKLPEGDFRKRRDSRGPKDARLLKEYETLYAKLVTIRRAHPKKLGKMPTRKLKPLAPKASRKKLSDAAESTPAVAACILIGSRYNLGADTVRNRISRARMST
jgi:hypothetical protein